MFPNARLCNAMIDRLTDQTHHRNGNRIVPAHANLGAAEEWERRLAMNKEWYKARLRWAEMANRDGLQC